MTCDASNNPPQQVLDGYVNVDVTLVLDGNPSVALSFTLPIAGGP